ncbi:hypothetical protein, unlikely [Trypanosoma congolense IL3000]|uniref:Uncharacterized protein n=1 Tax=Trypanosoma congolense (strain IL3000) TaxID=1068625 RepID=F9W3V0_TRYCI|nr:hypothetical protein, unlikely [Trypanosoma congolense IL3000]
MASGRVSLNEVRNITPTKGVVALASPFDLIISLQGNGLLDVATAHICRASKIYSTINQTVMHRGMEQKHSEANDLYLQQAASKQVTTDHLTTIRYLLHVPPAIGDETITQPTTNEKKIIAIQLSRDP